ncbi:hypothetical protein Hanom_Chr05g00438551 [Helianthus anomalus]
MREGYARKKTGGVEKAMNLKLKNVQTNQINQLPDDIDVTYTKYDDACESDLVKNVVEKVFEDENESDSIKFESPNSNFEDEEYIPKSKSKLNDDPNMIMYKTFGSEKLFSDDEFPIQNVNLKRLEKVFKLVEIEVSEIENLANIARYLNFKKDKSYYTKPRNSYFQKKIFKNERAGLGYNKKKSKQTISNIKFCEEDELC